MLPAEVSAWRLRLLRLYLRNRFRACFHSVRLEMAQPWREPDTPLVLYGNHHSWWDGLLEVEVFHRLQLDFRVMMEERQLRQFPFFRRTGAFGIDVDTAGGRQAGLLYAARFLRGKGKAARALLLFPEGKLHPSSEGISPFFGGLAGLARLVPNATFYPLAKHIQQYRHPRPEVIIRMGVPLRQSPSIADDFVQALETTWQEAAQQHLQPPGPATIWLRPPAAHRGATE